MTTDKQWYAVKVKWRCEKKVLDYLADKSITAYAPFKNKVHHYVRKKVINKIPLIPCYIFTHILPTDFITILQTPHVYNFVKNGSETMPVKDTEIEILRKIEGIDAEVLIEDVSFFKGQRVKVDQGALFGMSGVIDELYSKGKVIVTLDSIGVALKIEIDKRLLSVST